MPIGGSPVGMKLFFINKPWGAMQGGGETRVVCVTHNHGGGAGSPRSHTYPTPTPPRGGARASAISGLPSAQRRKRARRILLSLLVAEARRFPMPQYQSTTHRTAQLYPMARTTRYQRPDRTATLSRRPAWGARAGTSPSP